MQSFKRCNLYNKNIKIWENLNKQISLIQQLFQKQTTNLAKCIFINQSLVNQISFQAQMHDRKSNMNEVYTSRMALVLYFYYNFKMIKPLRSLFVLSIQEFKQY
ncbi:hypothetical protein TTHERM_000729249 (macronuclear) [Tetrahymena thermophila SB210]|uniref:Uncharacterized protein n=1 Tax=Tetrahymena thermophila (strain SB210) TaxID=312017 RepID=W7XHP8_TETTS|nr:hypothetical protein TTHERM_000729249 [Tetrahymena thermophila SB210]EWS72679.1 hypothetical protein TTHERM_000729249 [Tetrahymena thermophila SB210]|eukprot:XP_012654804.1 hypothetical protein TTHERM_000729249 [Tetrahymena thermophila SB210]